MKLKKGIHIFIFFLFVVFLIFLIALLEKGREISALELLCYIHAGNSGKYIAVNDYNNEKVKIFKVIPSHDSGFEYSGKKENGIPNTVTYSGSNMLLSFNS